MPNQVGYIRISSSDQNTERQLDGIIFDKIFTEKASSGSQERPQLTAMLE
jgi:DNA invertase Pin-like site-specific DNA recombinase